MNIRAYGDAAVLIDCESLEEAQSWFVALEAHAEAVLGARSVLLRGIPRCCVGSSRTHLRPLH